MSVTTHLHDDYTEIRVAGRFDFTMHREFRNAYHDTDPASNFVVDLRQTAYLDSSALGMLLLLREYVGGDGSRIRIENCNADVRNILHIANFQRLFKIDGLE